MSTVINSASASSRGRYLAPSKGQRFGNAFATAAARLGLPMGGLHELTVVGRRSGERRSVPVSPIEVGGVRYLVAPRGATDWVLNARAAGEVELRSGRRAQRCAVEEVRNDKVAILRAYLTEYRGTVKGFFDPVTPESSDEEFASVADGYPVFRLTPIP